MNKNTLYISFYDARAQKMVNEYIPSNTTSIGIRLMNKFNEFYIYFGIQLYYWNYRYMLSFESRKTEDLLFIIHVLEDHDGKPPAKRERRFYSKIYSLYGPEIETLIKPYIIEKKDKDPFIHPYYIAYKKRWLTPKHSQAKRIYHGLDNYELGVMFETLMSGVRKKIEKQNNTRAYYKKLLKKQ